MKGLFFRFIIRCCVNAIFLWILVGGFGEISGADSVLTFLVAGIIFSVVNGFLKPILKIFALPITVLTMGVFTLIINGFVLWLSIRLSPSISMTFFNSIIAGIAISTINYSLDRVINKKEIL